ncbi:MAG: hypothetical protein QXV17_15145 [Candidatus Micrarchaeaceae archaeon]
MLNREEGAEKNLAEAGLHMISIAKVLIEKIKLNFNARALYKGKYYSYQNILYENVRLLANYIIGKSNKLQFNILELRIKREDSTDIRNRVLSLTPQDRKG